MIRLLFLIIGVTLVACKTAGNRSRVMEVATPSTDIEKIYINAMGAAEGESAYYFSQFQANLSKDDERANAFLHFFLFHPGTIEPQTLETCATASSSLVQETCANLHILKGLPLPDSVARVNPYLKSFSEFAVASQMFTNETDRSALVTQAKASNSRSFVAAARVLLALNSRSDETAPSLQARRGYFQELAIPMLQKAAIKDLQDFVDTAMINIGLRNSFIASMSGAADGDNSQLLSAYYAKVWGMDAKVDASVQTLYADANQLLVQKASSLGITWVPEALNGRPVTSFIVADNWLGRMDAKYQNKNLNDQLKLLQVPSNSFQGIQNWKTLIADASDLARLGDTFILSSHPLVRLVEKQPGLSTYDPGKTSNTFLDFADYVKIFDDISQTLYKNAAKFGCSPNVYVRCASLEYLFHPVTLPMLYSVGNNAGALASRCFYKGAFESFSAQLAAQWETCGVFDLIGLFSTASFAGFIYEDARLHGLNSLFYRLGRGFYAGADSLGSIDKLELAIGRMGLAKPIADVIVASPLKRFMCLRYIAAESENKSWYTEDGLVDSSNTNFKDMLRRVSIYNRTTAAISAFEQNKTGAGLDPNSYEFYYRSHVAQYPGTQPMHCHTNADGEAVTIVTGIGTFSDQNLQKNLKF